MTTATDATDEPIPSLFAYDVAVSFTFEDESYARETIELLTMYGLRVLPDAFQDEPMDHISGKQYDNMTGAYLRQVRMFVVLISRAYSRKPYYFVERYVRSHPLQVADPVKFDDIHIVPVRLDQSQVPDAFNTKNLRQSMSAEDLAYDIAGKFRRS